MIRIKSMRTTRLNMLFGNDNTLFAPLWTVLCIPIAANDLALSLFYSMEGGTEVLFLFLLI